VIERALEIPAEKDPLSESPGSGHENRTSILELRGLGKAIWQGVDAQEYVNRERASWNG